MKKILYIHNPLLKLIYIDCYLFAKENNGIIFKSQLEDTINSYISSPINIENKTMEEMKENVRSFLIEMTSSVIKEKKIKHGKVKDFYFEEVVQEIEKEKVLNAFIEQGIEPHLFIKTILENTNKKKNVKYKFESFEEIANHYFNKSLTKNNFTSKEVDELLEDKYLTKKSKTNINNLTNYNLGCGIDDFTVEGIEQVQYNSEKLFDIKKIKNNLSVVDQIELKGLWQQLTQYLLSEGKELKEANAIVAKLSKEENVKDLYEALSEIKRRKTTPPSIIAAIKFHLNNKHKQELEKQSAFVM